MAAVTGLFATVQAVRDWIEAGLHHRQPVHLAAADGDPAQDATASAHESRFPDSNGLETGGLRSIWSRSG